MSRELGRAFSTAQARQHPDPGYEALARFAQPRMDGSPLERAGGRGPGDLDRLIVEITEETLVHSDTQLQAAIEPLRARGARLAVDDMGAGYSGLRQITTVPSVPPTSSSTAHCRLCHLSPHRRG